jgi:hypothetical protein
MRERKTKKYNDNLNFYNTDSFNPRILYPTLNFQIHLFKVYIYISVPVLQSAQGSISGILKDNLWNSLTPPAI